jgi:glycosyltransferase involved in cell wall biosynthesis
MRIDKNKYSVVIPVYNSEQTITDVVQGIIQTFHSNKLDCEIVLVNDGSKDNSWEVLRKIAKTNRNIIAINLLKNYGQHNAIYCGFQNASGDYVITMDDDMQNPPEEIIHLIDKTYEGYDVVFGKYSEKKHNLFRRMGSKIIDYLNYKIFTKPKEITLSNFRIIEKSVVDRILSYQTLFPYITGLSLMLSHKTGNVQVQHQKRSLGKSKYTLRKILDLVATILFSYSSFPIRFFGIVGFMIASASFVLGLILILKKLIAGFNVAGWTSLMVLFSFVGGYIIFMLSMLGEYLSRITNQTSSRQGFYIKEVVKSE